MTRPVAAADSYSTPVGVALTVTAPGVLTNDTDAEGQSLTAVLAAGPTHGVLGLNANGSFTYTPNPAFNGTDSFTYRANDGTIDGNTATVSIAVNTVPTAVDNAYATDEDTPLTVPAPGVLGNDTDIDLNTLTAVQVSGPSHGTLALAAAGSFVYTPAANFHGTDSFTYAANDGIGQSLAATVQITVNPVNDTPAAVADSRSMTAGTTLTVNAPGVLANDTDVDGDPLSAVLVSGPAHGVLSLQADGSFSYTPEAGFTGQDSFSYAASDGTVQSTAALVQITVNPVNNAPVSLADAYTTPAGVELTVAAPGVLANDSEPESQPMTGGSRLRHRPRTAGAESQWVVRLHAKPGFQWRRQFLVQGQRRHQ